MKSILKRMMQVSLITASLLGATTVQADQIRYMAKGQTAIAQIYEMLNSAQKSVDLATYIWANDHTIGKMINTILIKKLKTIPGFKVRILIDAHTQQDSAQQKNMASFFYSIGADFRYFNNVSKFNPSYNVRNHAKIIIVDNREYYIGGRNIADDYFGIAGGVNWIDRDVWVKGPSARDAQAEFNMLWDSGYPTPHKEYPTQEAYQEWVKKDQAWNAQDKAVWNHLNKNSKQMVALAPTFQCADIEPQVDDPDYANGLHGRGGTFMNALRLNKKKTTKTILELVKNARKEIVMENYSYAPHGKFAFELTKQRENNLPIAVVGNLDMDGMLGHVQNTRISSDNTGSQINITTTPRGKMNDRWALTPKFKTNDKGVKEPTVWHIHSKVFLNEDETFVSSWNIDPRSYEVNIEAGVLVRSCPAFNKHVRNETLKLAKINIDDQKNCQAKDCLKAPDISFMDKLGAFIGHNLL